ncbi:hypothetical protein GCM10020220_026260 [Nonomuraea rubra]
MDTCEWLPTTSGYDLWRVQSPAEPTRWTDSGGHVGLGNGIRVPRWSGERDDSRQAAQRRCTRRPCGASALLRRASGRAPLDAWAARREGALPGSQRRLTSFRVAEKTAGLGAAVAVVPPRARPAALGSSWTCHLAGGAMQVSA